MVKDGDITAERTIWVDNVRGILIFLVVFGHSMAGEPSFHENVFGYSHYLIYSVHMPMFILVSGFLSKKQPNFKKVMRNYIIPYIIFDFLYALIHVVVFKQSWHALNVLTPIYVYWFILCLGLMKMVLILTKGRYKYILMGGGGILITLLTPMFLSEGYWRFLSLGRLVLLWAIFSVGICLDGKVVNFFASKRWLALSIGALCVVLELILLKLRIVDITWATHDYPHTIDQSILRYVFMLFTIGLFFALASVVQKPMGWITKWGRNSILIYLLHPYLLDVLGRIIPKAGSEWNSVLYVCLLVVATLICQFLSLEFLKRTYNGAMNKVACVLRLN